MKEILTDLETLATRPGAVIATIGAVVIDSDFDYLAQEEGEEPNQAITEVFYHRIDLSSAIRDGLAVDADTAKWWLTDTSPEARVEVFSFRNPQYPRVSLRYALEKFAELVTECRREGEVRVIGNGPSFDLSILGAAFEAVGQDIPWRYWEERCFRTEMEIFDRYGVPEGRYTNSYPHHALYDAVTEGSLLCSRRSMAARMAAGEEPVSSSRIEAEGGEE